MYGQYQLVATRHNNSYYLFSNFDVELVDVMDVVFDKVGREVIAEVDHDFGDVVDALHRLGYEQEPAGKDFAIFQVHVQPVYRPTWFFY
jgi:hypothetical protein